MCPLRRLRDQGRDHVPREVGGLPGLRTTRGEDARPVPRTGWKALALAGSPPAHPRIRGAPPHTPLSGELCGGSPSGAHRPNNPSGGEGAPIHSLLPGRPAGRVTVQRALRCKPLKNPAPCTEGASANVRLSPGSLPGTGCGAEPHRSEGRGGWASEPHCSATWGVMPRRPSPHRDAMLGVWRTCALADDVDDREVLVVRPEEVEAGGARRQRTAGAQTHAGGVFGRPAVERE